MLFHEVNKFGTGGTNVILVSQYHLTIVAQTLLIKFAFLDKTLILLIICCFGIQNLCLDFGGCVLNFAYTILVK